MHVAELEVGAERGVRDAGRPAAGRRHHKEHVVQVLHGTAHQEMSMSVAMEMSRLAPILPLLVTHSINSIM